MATTKKQDRAGVFARGRTTEPSEGWDVPGTRANNVGVFCGSRDGASAAYVEAARSLGAELARRGAGLVYGAGGVGVMGAIASAALRGGARVTGVIPRDLYERERPGRTNGKIVIARTMHDRKALMYRLSDGFAVLPGGFGTLEELMEVVTWNQLGFHCKPVVLVNCDGYYDPLISMLDHMATQGFISPDDRALIGVAITPEDALDQLGWPARSCPEGDRGIAGIDVAPMPLGEERHRGVPLRRIAPWMARQPAKSADLSHKGATGWPVMVTSVFPHRTRRGLSMPSRAPAIVIKGWNGFAWG
jgi:uncharacterized protein (TIGR00730 family)